MEECGASLRTFPEETLPTVSWPWTVTLTPRTFRSHVGKSSKGGLKHNGSERRMVYGAKIYSSSVLDFVCFLFDTSGFSLRIQVFHCLKHEGTGGKTLLVDGFYAAEKLRQQSPENFELLARVPINHNYIENTGNHRNHMTGIGPVLNVYPWNNEIYMIRYVGKY